MSTPLHSMLRGPLGKANARLITGIRLNRVIEPMTDADLVLFGVLASDIPTVRAQAHAIVGDGVAA